MKRWRDFSWAALNTGRKQRRRGLEQGGRGGGGKLHADGHKV